MFSLFQFWLFVMHFCRYSVGVEPKCFLNGIGEMDWLLKPTVWLASHLSFLHVSSGRLFESQISDKLSCRYSRYFFHLWCSWALLIPTSSDKSFDIMVRDQPDSHWSTSWFCPSKHQLPTTLTSTILSFALELQKFPLRRRTLSIRLSINI